MSNIKCPFCGQELKIAGEHTTIMSCFNGDCKGSGLYGEKAFWQALIRTRKALDRAKLILKNLLPDLNGYERLDVEKSIKEITALEQKDVK